MTRRLIVNADDFGQSGEINTAIERAHREGIRTSASLRMGEAAVADALDRARRNPDLRVGLHLTVVNGSPVLPREQVAHLTDAQGRFSSALLTSGVRFALHPAARRELRREVEAQFRAFVDTGLELDHVNAHHHMHLHPFVGALAVEGARRFGATGVRTVVEPPQPLRQADRRGPGIVAALLRLYTRRMRRRVPASGCVCNDHIFGLAWTGALTEHRLLALLPHLPEGVSELFAHPRPTPAGQAELTALTSPAVRNAIRQHDITLTTYAQLGDGRER